MGVELLLDGRGATEYIARKNVTTRPPGEGTGLGLWLCRAIAEEHKGRIDVGESPLGGASFTYWLPGRDGD